MYNSRVRMTAFPARIEAVSLRGWSAHLASRLAVEARKTRWPVLILVLHFAFGVIYSTVIPIWEAYDETGHYTYVRYLANQRTLPPVDQKISSFLDESHQPPLYYILGALATFWMDTSDNFTLAPNPYGRDGTGLRGFNFLVHTDVERFPWQGTVAAIHIARLVSVLVTTGTVGLTYLIGRKLFPQQPGIALGAMAVNAFLPQFLFIGAIVNNDSLITLTSAAVLLAGLDLVYSPPRLRTLVAAGLALGFSLLTKNSALALVPFLGLVLLIAAWRQRAGWRRLVTWGGVVFGLTALLAGPWYGYNWLRYGRPIIDRAPDNPIIQTISPFGESLGTALSRSWVLTLINNTFRSYWAAFGWGNIVYPDRVYLVLGLVCLVGLAGAVAIVAARRRWGVEQETAAGAVDYRLGLVLIAVQAVLVVALALYRAVYFRDPMLVPGRYLLPAVSGLSLLLFVGWARWLGPARTPALAAGAGVLLGALALVTPWTTIAPAYARPPILTPAEAQIAHPVSLRFGDGLELLGYDLSPERIHPGETMWVTLVWRARARMSENYTIGIHLLDGDLRDWGQIDTFPGRGNYATSLWQPGDIIRDTYPVRLRADAPAPALGQVAVGVQLYPPGSALPVTDEQGRTVTPIFGRFKIVATALASTPPAPVQYRLGQSLALVGIELPTGPVHVGETVQVRLTWWVQAGMGGDYTAFLHALDASGISFQADRPPLEGAYPTGLWEAGELVTDTIILAVPADTAAGSYRLVTGLYDRQTNVRLPAFAADGQRLPDDAIPLGVITVAP